MGRKRIATDPGIAGHVTDRSQCSCSYEGESQVTTDDQNRSVAKPNHLQNTIPQSQLGFLCTQSFGQALADSADAALRRGAACPVLQR